MADTDPAIVGVQSCGCITYANAAPSCLDRDDERALMRIVREGGQIVHTTVGEARAMAHFLEPKCPHDPKGWESYVEPPVRPRTKIDRGRDLRIVYLGHRRLGEVRKWDGAWEATRGWFKYRAAGADDGSSEREGCEVLRPFSLLREAIDALVSSEVAA